MDHPDLALVAEHIPHGFECRSCGGSAYNWVAKCARYAATGEGCCADFRSWIAKAKADEPTVEERHKARLAAAAKMPWPVGCIKPQACSRHQTCVYAMSADKCRHFGKDLTADIAAAETRGRP